MPKTNDRGAQYQIVAKELEAAGYIPIRPLFLDRWMTFRLVTVAVNVIAAMLSKEPIRIYQALLCRAERSARGRSFGPENQESPTAEGLLEGGRRLHVWCPRCGIDLIDAGKISPEEARLERAAQIEHRKREAAERREEAAEKEKGPEGPKGPEGSKGV